jgi:hypothetical protein
MSEHDVAIGMANHPAISGFLLLAPFDMQETTCSPAVNVVFGVQLITVNMTGNEFPNNNRHAVWTAELK